MIHMAETFSTGEYATVISISEKLGISKIYLEQVFSLLKKGKIVNSVKGSQGGYQLVRIPRQITLLDVFSAVELSLFEPIEDTVSKNAPEIEAAMRLSAFEKMDEALKSVMESVTLYDLAFETAKHRSEDGFMFYI